jgi:hypothetical protein
MLRSLVLSLLLLMLCLLSLVATSAEHQHQQTDGVGAMEQTAQAALHHHRMQHPSAEAAHTPIDSTTHPILAGKMHGVHRMRLADFVGYWMRALAVEGGRRGAASASTAAPKSHKSSDFSGMFRWSIAASPTASDEHGSQTNSPETGIALTQPTMGELERRKEQVMGAAAASALSPSRTLPAMFTSFQRTLRNLADMVEQTVHAGDCKPIKPVELHVEMGGVGAGSALALDCEDIMPLDLRVCKTLSDAAKSDAQCCSIASMQEDASFVLKYSDGRRCEYELSGGLQPCRCILQPTTAGNSTATATTAQGQPQKPSLLSLYDQFSLKYRYVPFKALREVLSVREGESALSPDKAPPPAVEALHEHIASARQHLDASTSLDSTMVSSSPQVLQMECPTDYYWYNATDQTCVAIPPGQFLVNKLRAWSALFIFCAVMTVVGGVLIVVHSLDCTLASCCCGQRSCTQRLARLVRLLLCGGLARSKTQRDADNGIADNDVPLPSQDIAAGGGAGGRAVLKRSRLVKRQRDSLLLHHDHSAAEADDERTAMHQRPSGDVVSTRVVGSSTAATAAAASNIIRSSKLSAAAVAAAGRHHHHHHHHAQR